MKRDDDKAAAPSLRVDVVETGQRPRRGRTPCEIGGDLTMIEALGKFGEHAVLHFGGDELEHLIEQLALAFVVQSRGLEKQVRDLAQEFAAFAAIGRPGEIDQLRITRHYRADSQKQRTGD